MKLHKSPYLRLTLFYVLIVMTISMLFSFVIFNLSSKELDSGLGRQSRVIWNIGQNNGMMTPFSDIDQIRQNQLSESEDNLRDNLIYWNLIILILSSFLSYFLAKSSMRPIEDALYSQNCFTADASHELRTPLTAMKTEVEVALRDKEMSLADAKKLLESNLEEIEKLESLSGALLKIARSRESVKASFSKISLPDVVLEAYDKVESLAKKKSIHFTFKGQAKDLFVHGDAPSLNELFVILFDNAIKYSDEKSKVDIYLSADKKHAVVSVKDHGVGIKAGDVPYIFNRFYRADNSRVRNVPGGYGLGLSIARNIAEMHDGIITIESQPGHGSEFRVTFPLLHLPK